VDGSEQQNAHLVKSVLTNSEVVAEHRVSCFVLSLMCFFLAAVAILLCYIW